MFRVTLQTDGLERLPAGEHTTGGVPLTTSKPPRFGVRIPVAGPLASRQGITRSAQEAERLGFDTLWVHDYLVWNRLLDSIHISCGSKEAFLEAVDRVDYEPTFFESITNIAYLAGITERIRLGIAVLCLPYREPLFTAKQIPPRAEQRWP
jgi:alkanesulfonate monooxygenase SsuD/methylene tetrahydromethanopterin reductase-like flavin-dependent oxidoreductase (luciferase family)